MVQRVVLKLDGNLKQGFKVTVEVGVEGESPKTELQGKLPPHPKLEEWIHYWQSKYQNLEFQTRLLPKQIVHSKPAIDLIKDCSTSAYQFGEHFQEWLESVEFARVDRTLRAILNTNETIHVLIRSEDNQLANLPWHLWDFFEVFQNAEVGFSTSNYRRSNNQEIEILRNKVRVLAILGSRDSIDIETDRAILNNYSDAEIQFLVEPKREELNEQLWSDRWDIFFFAGHSQTNGNGGEIHINSSDVLNIEDLKYCLRKSVKQGLQLVIFNSCSGLGLAYELEALNIPQIIVMREPIPDRVAQNFLKGFLQSFSRGKTLYESVREAREKLKILENEFPCATWLPIIFQNPADVPSTWKDLGGFIKDGNYQDDSQDEESKVKAPKFELHQIMPITELGSVCLDRKGNVKTIGKVIECIRQDYTGRVSYGPSSWRACLHPNFQKSNQIPEGEDVTVVGTVGKSGVLVVVPHGYPVPQPESQEKSGFPFSLFNSFKSLASRLAYLIYLD